MYTNVVIHVHVHVLYILWTSGGGYFSDAEEVPCVAGQVFRYKQLPVVV